MNGENGMLFLYQRIPIGTIQEKQDLVLKAMATLAIALNEWVNEETSNQDEVHTHSLWVESSRTPTGSIGYLTIRLKDKFTRLVDEVLVEFHYDDGSELTGFFLDGHPVTLVGVFRRITQRIPVHV